ncbi:hypothetical protein PsorP6_014195 [Peronosclerospora sorghi]|uniref:Uncharacterized protein n=1 Tax=Peronosclerospora sorghi TaxID=230839 RepID=A0ACC0VIT8_9STRA|nr:hypothetical protein PsorP6_014195 [Peronosclerospora sorghi]
MAFRGTEQGATVASSLAAWPRSAAANFTNLSHEAGVKMILPPKAYYATHDTMPPPNQVLTMKPSCTVVHERNPSSDPQVSRKKRIGANPIAGKKRNGEQSSSPRPPKSHRL